MGENIGETALEIFATSLDLSTCFVDVICLAMYLTARNYHYFINAVYVFWFPLWVAGLGMIACLFVSVVSPLAFKLQTPKSVKIYLCVLTYGPGVLAIP